MQHTVNSMQVKVQREKKTTKIISSSNLHHLTFYSTWILIYILSDILSGILSERERETDRQKEAGDHGIPQVEGRINQGVYNVQKEAPAAPPFFEPLFGKHANESVGGVGKLKASDRARFGQLNTPLTPLCFGELLSQVTPFPFETLFSIAGRMLLWNTASPKRKLFP